MEVELRPISSTRPDWDESPSESNNDDTHLPPVDKGKDAYLFLAACFAIEALIWGNLSALNGENRLNIL